MRVPGILLAYAFAPSAEIRGFYRPLTVRFFLIVLLSISALISGCATSSARLGDSKETRVSASGSELIYSGRISFEANQRLFELAASLGEMPKTLVITSKGGDVAAGLELGRWVFDSGLDVSIPEYCMSSCANYVFVAGAQKILASQASLMWHGGATQRFDVDCDSVNWSESAAVCDEQQLRELVQATIARLIPLETEFFETVGVDQRITTFGQQPEYACAGGRGHVGWYYSISDLASLGVDRIQVRGGEWRPKTQTADFNICRVDLRR